MPIKNLTSFHSTGDIALPKRVSDPTIQKSTPTRVIGNTDSPGSQGIKSLMAMLKMNNIQDLSSLGTCKFDGNFIISESGLATPNNNQMTQLPQIHFGGITGLDSSGNPAFVNGIAYKLQTFPFRKTQPSGNTVTPHFLSYLLPVAGDSPANSAIIIADEILFIDHCRLIIGPGLSSIRIAANKITFGNNVQITWLHRNIDSSLLKSSPVTVTLPDSMHTQLTEWTPQQDYDTWVKDVKNSYPKPTAFLQKSTSTDRFHPNNGQDGTPGFAPKFTLPDGADAPNLEIFAKEVTGQIAYIDLNGDPGVCGFPGGDGQDGDSGQKGKSSENNGVWCTAGPGFGGHGGNGGPGGNGQNGSRGGKGGDIAVYSLPGGITKLFNSLDIHNSGGAGGRGGKAGKGGKGGLGGPQGDLTRGTVQDCTRVDGRDGANGTDGADGTDGQPGQNGADGQHPVIYEISESDWNTVLNLPVIFTVQPDGGRFAGTPFSEATGNILITGNQFSTSDQVFMDGALVGNTTLRDEHTIKFALTNVLGGVKYLKVRQQDGDESNIVKLTIVPVISKISQGSADSSTPGSKFFSGQTVRITGSGFYQGCAATINGSGATVTFVDQNNLEIMLSRPQMVSVTLDVEKVAIQVIGPDGVKSNSLEIVLDTFNCLVVGDSVMWGQGLAEDQKFSTLVENYVTSKLPGIGFYKEAYPHSGAVLGDPNAALGTQQNPDGEVPNHLPNLFHQIGFYKGNPSNVDLILLDGGANDLDFVNAVLFGDEASIRSQANLVCNQTMTLLLDTALTRFPHANIIVTNYYQGLSEQSDLKSVEYMLAAIGVLCTGPLAAFASLTTAAWIEKIIANSKAFAESTTISLQAAIDQANASIGSTRVLFAKNTFGPNNAAFASDPFIYGFYGNSNSPEDRNVMLNRQAACALSGRTGLDRFFCDNASLFHPNSKGAANYAAAIIPLIDDLIARKMLNS